MPLLSHLLIGLFAVLTAAQPHEIRTGRDAEFPAIGRPDVPPEFEPVQPLRRPPAEPVPVAPEPPPNIPGPVPGVPEPAPPTPQIAPDAGPGAFPPSRINSEFLFLRRSFTSADPAALDALYAQARALRAASPDGERADQIQYLLLEIRRKQKRPLAALLEGFKLLYEYPGSALSFNAKRMLHDIAAESFKHRRDAVSKITEGPRIGLSRAQRVAALLDRLASFADRDFYEATVAQFREFFELYPAYGDRDSLSYLLAGLHARNGAPRPAVFLYESILALSDKKGLQASALSAAGDLHAGALRDPEGAVGAYQSLADGFPESEEAQLAYGKWGRLLDEKLKQPMLAVEVLEKAVQLYPQTDTAHDALSDGARILAERLKNRARAVETLERLADMFPGTRAVAGLRRAAALHGRARDYAAQARTLIRISRRYPDDSFAAEALWDAARLYDKKLKDETKARGVYADLIEAYPQDRFAAKARRRLESLE